MIPTSNVVSMAPTDPRKELLARVAAYRLPRVCHNQVILATYIRPEKIGNILMPDKVRDEDRYQSKVGLVIALGPLAGIDPKNEYNWHNPIDADGKQLPGMKVGDWVVYRGADGWNWTLGGSNGIPCRWMNDTSIRGFVDDPEQVW